LDLSRIARRDNRGFYVMPAKHFVTCGKRSDRLRRSESKRANNEATFRTIADWPNRGTGIFAEMALDDCPAPPRDSAAVQCSTNDRALFARSVSIVRGCPPGSRARVQASSHTLLSVHLDSLRSFILGHMGSITPINQANYRLSSRYRPSFSREKYVVPA
jgi:hypothetical protein